jgi:hypothetical protein
MQKVKIVVNIIFWSQNYGKMTDDYIYIYTYVYKYTYIYIRKTETVKYEFKKDAN